MISKKKKRFVKNQRKRYFMFVMLLILFFMIGVGYSTLLSTKLTIGVRPAVSLVPGTEFSSGDGSTANPYVVRMN